MSLIFYILLFLCYICAILVAIDENQNDELVVADSIFTHNFIVRSNNFQQITRHVNHETKRIQQSILIDGPVDASEESLRMMIVDVYCSQIAHNAKRDDCLQSMESLVENFRKHSEKENRTVVIETLSAQVADVGFLRRMQQRDQRMVHEENNCVKQGQFDRNLGGDMAILVTGYWYVPKTKYYDHSKEGSPFDKDSIDASITDIRGLAHGLSSNINSNKVNVYNDWFNSSLRINMPYIIFTEPSSFLTLAKHRRNLPTLYVPYNEDNFFLRFPEELMKETDEWTHEKHVPSKKLSHIWLEKMNLIKLASQLEPNAEFYVWIDAGIVTYRHQQPPSTEWSKEVLSSLPKDRISYSRVEGEYHSFAATVMLFPKSMIPIAHYIFYGLHRDCLAEIRDWRCGSEQFIWTLALIRYPDMFHAISYDYGSIAFMWGSNVQWVNSCPHE